MRKYIDTNCFIGIPPTPHLKSFQYPADLILDMDDIGIEKSFVTSFCAQKEFFDGNYNLCKDISGYDRLLPCWIAGPGILCREDYCLGFISDVKKYNIRMVRIQPGTVNGFSLYGWAMDGFIEGLIENNVILFIDLLYEQGLSHKAVPEYEWEIIYRFACKYLKLPVILSGRKLSVSKMQVMGLLKSCKNIMLDISSFQTWLSTETICAQIGSDRLVFGSYMPYFDAAQFLVQIELSNASEKDKDRIAYMNISELL